jgi:formylglycine-generating enzyme required for sulfatase activity/serine/threonine protein phosphatase PrpC
MSVIFDIAGSQIKGSRDFQEDAFLITHIGLTQIDKDDTGALIVVADGMGGQAAGNVASNIVAQTFSKHLTSHYPSNDITGVFHEGLEEANQALAVTVQETQALTGMGCTLVSVLFEKSLYGRSSMRWLSVGDSHLYLLRNNVLQKKNANHSYGAYLDQMAAQGTPIEPKIGCVRNMLLSSITGGAINLVDCPQARLQLEEGDRIIIATDGLDTLNSDKIIDICTGATAAKACVDKLLEAVVAAKKRHQDNTTVVVVDVLAKQPAGSPLVWKSLPPVNTRRTGSTTRVVRNTGRVAKINSPAINSPKKKKTWAKRPGIIGGVGAVAGIALLVVMNQAPELLPELLGESVHGEPGKAPAEPLAFEGSDNSQVPFLPAKRVIRRFQSKLRSGGFGPEMVWIHTGSFIMGGSDLLANQDEQPEHTVSIARFAISTHEITWADYDIFLRATGIKRPDSHLMRGDYPVVLVTWDEAVAYTRWLSHQTGHSYRLPSEAEWEYAAAAETTTPYWWGDKIGKDWARCQDCSTDLRPSGPIQIGSFKPNRFGLYDTAGNVLEWVQDCYHPSYLGAPTDGRAWETGNCYFRVVRGGAYTSVSTSLRTRKRDRYRKDQGYRNIGFRVVREP